MRKSQRLPSFAPVFCTLRATAFSFTIIFSHLFFIRLLPNGIKAKREGFAGFAFDNTETNLSIHSPSLSSQSNKSQADRLKTYQNRSKLRSAACQPAPYLPNLIKTLFLSFAAHRHQTSKHSTHKTHAPTLTPTDGDPPLIPAAASAPRPASSFRDPFSRTLQDARLVRRVPRERRSDAVRPQQPDARDRRRPHDHPLHRLRHPLPGLLRHLPRNPERGERRALKSPTCSFSRFAGKKQSLLKLSFLQLQRFTTFLSVTLSLFVGTAILCEYPRHSILHLSRS